MDYYGILGVAPWASHEEVRAAYRHLAKRWHPDRYSRAPKQLRHRAERQMRLLTAAYSVLGDESRRQAYDDRRRIYGRPEDAMEYSAAASANEQGATQAADPNPNGAGQFAGILALIVALALFGGAVSGGLGSNPGVIVIFGAIAVLLVLAALFASNSSLLARAANAYMAGEPQGFNVRYEPWAEPSPIDQDADEDTQRFEQIVDEALADVPDEFRPYMGNLVVRVEDEPSAETLRQAGVGPGSTLLGLYTGVPLTAQGIAGAGPEVISIYRRPIERYCGNDPNRIRAQVLATVLHELAHHFGIDHDDMPEWVK